MEELKSREVTPAGTSVEARGLQPAPGNRVLKIREASFHTQTLFLNYEGFNLNMNSVLLYDSQSQSSFRSGLRREEEALGDDIHSIPGRFRDGPGCQERGVLLCSRGHWCK